jgi:hypothetical protein
MVAKGLLWAQPLGRMTVLLVSQCSPQGSWLSGSNYQAVTDPSPIRRPHLISVPVMSSSWVSMNRQWISNLGYCIFIKSPSAAFSQWDGEVPSGHKQHTPLLIDSAVTSAKWPAGNLRPSLLPHTTLRESQYRDQSSFVKPVKNL